MSEVRYILTMTPAQARAVNKAVELMMRLRLGQYEEIPWAIMDIGSESCWERRDGAMPLLRAAFEAMAPAGGWRDDTDTNRLYDIHQVVRHALWEVESPRSHGVDSDIPRCTSGEKLPQIRIDREV